MGYVCEGFVMRDDGPDFHASDVTAPKGVKSLRESLEFP